MDDCLSVIKLTFMYCYLIMAKVCASYRCPQGEISIIVDLIFHILMLSLECARFSANFLNTS